MEFLASFSPELTVDSPGRINFIGEHTDYNMGYVLPTAIANKIVFKFQKNNSDHTFSIYSKTYKTGFKGDLRKIAKSKTEWENYLLGVLSEILMRIEPGSLKGFNCTLESDLPTGSGLSSSAALECGFAFGLNTLFNLGLTKMQIVQLAQTAEHTYVGTQCGIMDQFASVMSKEDHIILLDCKSLAYELIPLDLHPFKIILLNTKVSHNLASSAYNTRKSECEQGVAIIQKTFSEVSSLRDVDSEMLKTCRHDLSKTVFDRCSFIVSENKRVLLMVEALKKRDLAAAGKILYEAHHGISALYEVSCVESDFLVNFSKPFNGVLGARQTGGGFGGCTLNIVHENEVDHYIKAASIAYQKEFNIALDAFEVKPTGGTALR